MPYIHLQTTKSISAETEKQLNASFGKLIEDLPGKTERWLMIRTEGDCHMAFAGVCGDCAMVEIAVFGEQNPRDYDRLTRDLTDYLAKELSLAKDRIYVKYGEYNRWGFAGENF